MDEKGFERILFDLQDEEKTDEILTILENNEDMVMLYNKMVGEPDGEYEGEYQEIYKKLDRWVSHMLDGDI